MLLISNVILSGRR